MTQTSLGFSLLCLLLTSALSGCASSRGADAEPIVFGAFEFTMQGTKSQPLGGGANQTDDVTVEWRGLAPMLDLRGETAEAWEVTMKGPASENTYYLDRTTFEPYAIAIQGIGTVFFMDGVYTDDSIVFAPLHWAGTSFQPGERRQVSYLGQEAELVVTSPTHAQLRFGMRAPEQEVPAFSFSVYDFTLEPGIALPRLVRSWGEDAMGRTDPRTRWAADVIEVGTPLHARPDPAGTAFEPLGPFYPWDGSPSNDAPAEVPFAPEDAVRWARQDVAEVDGFFRRYPDAFLVDGAYYNQSVGVVGVGGLDIGHVWRMQWWSAGETIQFAVHWDPPFLPDPLSHHFTDGVEHGSNNVRAEDMELDRRLRPPMMAWGDAYARCVEAAAGEPGLLFAYEDDFGMMGPATIEVGGVLWQPSARFQCGGTIARPIALDAYTGRLWAAAPL